MRICSNVSEKWTSMCLYFFVNKEVLLQDVTNVTEKVQGVSQ